MPRLKQWWGKIGIGLIIICSLLLISAPPVQAQQNQRIVPCGGPGQDACTVNHFFELLANIYNWLLGLAAVVAILFVVVSGLGMLTYHFFENPDQVLQGSKYTLTRAIFGFIIIAIAYVVVNTLLITILGINQGGALGALLKQTGIIQ